jgi:hypothetical protein
MDSTENSPLLIFLLLGMIILPIAAIWKIFDKAGQPGWASIVPFYGAIVFFRVIGKPWWWLFLFMIPIVNVIFLIWSINLLAKSFGKDEFFTIGLVILGIIFYPILAFGDASYIGPAGLAAVPQPQRPTQPPVAPTPASTAVPQSAYTSYRKNTYVDEENSPLPMTPGAPPPAGPSMAPPDPTPDAGKGAYRKGSLY